MFLVCGEALWDLFAIDGAGGLSFDARIGGSSFNVAVGLARLGQRSALFTGLSTDRLGERLHAALEDEGVATRYLVRTNRPSTLSVVDVAVDGSPVYAFYGQGAADRCVALADLPELGPEVWGLHAGSFSLVAEPVGSSLLALFEREAGHRLLTLDPNVRLNVEAEAVWRHRIDAFVRYSDLVKVSVEDLHLLYPNADPSDIVTRWQDAGAGLVVITHGADGAEAYGAAGRVRVPGRRVNVVDTVGAGDSFQAALVAGLAERGIRTRARIDTLSREETASIVTAAIHASSVTCSRRGADLPRRADLATSATEIL